MTTLPQACKLAHTAVSGRPEARTSPGATVGTSAGLRSRREPEQATPMGFTGPSWRKNTDTAAATVTRLDTVCFSARNAPKDERSLL